MKPYVICHMMPSVDGRLRTDRWDVPEAGHKEYERTADTYHADAWVCGRKTMEEFAKGRRRPKRARTGKIPRTDYVIPREKGKRFAIAIDTRGKLAWSDNEVEGDPLIEILTEDVPDSVEGAHHRKAMAKLRLKSVRRAAADMLWIRYAVRTNGRAD